MITLFYFVNALTFLGLGFLFGYVCQKEPIKDFIEDTKKQLKKSTSPVGVIRRPTQEDILKRTDPHEKKIEEGKEAMRETLENIPELK